MRHPFAASPEQLHAAGLRATTGRIAILRVLASARTPLAVPGVLRALHGTRGADQATVYRTLAVLERAQLIRRVDFAHDHVHYELVPAEDHHHCICTSCGAVEDFTGCGIDAVVTRVLRRSRMFDIVDRHALELFGVCRACRRGRRRRVTE